MRTRPGSPDLKKKGAPSPTTKGRGSPAGKFLTAHIFPPFPDNIKAFDPLPLSAMPQSGAGIISENSRSYKILREIPEAGDQDGEQAESCDHFEFSMPTKSMNIAGKPKLISKSAIAFSISRSPDRFDKFRLADGYVASSELSGKFQAGANYPEFSARANSRSCQRARDFRDSGNYRGKFRNR